MAKKIRKLPSKHSSSTLGGNSLKRLEAELHGKQPRVIRDLNTGEVLERHPRKEENNCE